MILTVTPNSAVDHVIFVDELHLGGTTIALDIMKCIGGKGFVTSSVLNALSVENIALGFVAGPTGLSLANMLDSSKVTNRLVWVGGETRIIYVIVENQTRKITHLNTQELSINHEHCTLLLEQLVSNSSNVKWVIGAGSLPPGLPPNFYSRIVETAQQINSFTLLDISGATAKLVLQNPPNILKMNYAEFITTFQIKPTKLSDLYAAIQNLRETAHLNALVVTCNKKGIVACSDEGTYHAIGPEITPVNSAGAGDATSAAICWRLEKGETWHQALRWGCAAGTATAMTRGTGECYLDDVLRILPKVEVSNKSDTRYV